MQKISKQLHEGKIYTLSAMSATIYSDTTSILAQICPVSRYLDKKVAVLDLVPGLGRITTLVQNLIRILLCGIMVHGGRLCLSRLL
jgi:hypothetical protein